MKLKILLQAEERIWWLINGRVMSFAIGGFHTQRLAVSGAPKGRRRTTSRWFYKSIEDLLLESVGETPLYKRYSLAPILHWDHKSTRSQMEEDDQLGVHLVRRKFHNIFVLHVSLLRSMTKRWSVFKRCAVEFLQTSVGLNLEQLNWTFYRSHH